MPRAVSDRGGLQPAIRPGPLPHADRQRMMPRACGGRSRLVWGEQALAVGDAEEEPEPGEVLAQRAGAVGGAADEPGQGPGEVAVVGFQPAAEELQQLGELDGVPGVQGHGWHHVAPWGSASPASSWAMRRSANRLLERAAWSRSSRVRLSVVSWRTRCLRVVFSVVVRAMASL